MLAVHRRTETNIYPLQGDEVYELLMGRTQLKNDEPIIQAVIRPVLFEEAA